MTEPTSDGWESECKETVQGWSLRQSHGYYVKAMVIMSKPWSDCHYVKEMFIRSKPWSDRHYVKAMVIMSKPWSLCQSHGKYTLHGGNISLNFDGRHNLSSLNLSKSQH